MNTLDWKKVESFIAERQPREVSAGLLEDWFWTAATVYEGGEWKDRDRAYVTSYWATPGFKAEMPNGDVIEVVASTEQTPEQAAANKARSEKARAELRDLVAKIKAEREA